METVGDTPSDPISNHWQGPEAEMSPWDILFVPARYWIRTLFCFVLLVAAVVTATVMTPKAYESEAKLLVRLGRENMGLDPTATLGNSQNVSMTQTRQTEINTVASVLRNRNLAEQVVDKLGAERILDRRPGDTDGTDDGPTEEATKLSPELLELAGRLVPSMNLEPREKAIRLLQKEIRVDAVSDSNLVSISFASSKPELSRDVVAALVDLYLEEHVALHRNAGAYEFLLREKEAVQASLRQAEEQLRALKSKTGLISPAEQRGTLVAQIARLQDQHSDVLAQTAEVGAEVKMLQEKLSNLSDTLVLQETKGAANYASDGMREQLYELQLAEKRLLASHTEEHYDVKRIRRQIEEAEKILAAEQEHRTEITTGPNRVYEETQLQLIRKEPVLSALTVKDQKLSELLAGLEQDLQDLNHHELEVARLDREVAIQEANYRKYSIDTEQARIDNSLLNARLSNIGIAQPATIDPYPAYPNTKLNLLLGFVFAFCASCGLAFVSDSYDRWRQRRRRQTQPPLRVEQVVVADDRPSVKPDPLPADLEACEEELATVGTTVGTRPR